MDEGLVERLKMYMQLRFSTPSKISGEVYQMVPPETVLEAIDRINALEAEVKDLKAKLGGHHD